MGSPITTWEGAGAYFTGAGGSSPVIILILSVIVCFGCIVYGMRHEEEAYRAHKDD